MQIGFFERDKIGSENFSRTACWETFFEIPILFIAAAPVYFFTKPRALVCQFFCHLSGVARGRPGGVLEVRWESWGSRAGSQSSQKGTRKIDRTLEQFLYCSVILSVPPTRLSGQEV